MTVLPSASAMPVMPAAMPMKAGICMEKGEKPIRSGPASPDADALLEGAAASPALQAAREMPTARVAATAKGLRTERRGLLLRDMACTFASRSAGRRAVADVSTMLFIV